MSREKEIQNVIATSIRIPEERNEYLRKKAHEIGMSQNAFMVMMIDLGIKLYESGIIQNPKLE